MAHKAFEVIGKRVMIVEAKDKNLEGIFQENLDWVTSAEGEPRPALDFIYPIYNNENPLIERLAMGIKPRKRIHPENPILAICVRIDQLKLRYFDESEGVHIFTGKLCYLGGYHFNDGNRRVFDSYKKELRKAGFKIK